MKMVLTNQSIVTTATETSSEESNSIIALPVRKTTARIVMPRKKLKRNVITPLRRNL